MKGKQKSRQLFLHNHKLEQKGRAVLKLKRDQKNASPANPGATNPANMTKEELMKALDELEEQAISDIGG